jgi:hypothetical protein
MAISFFLSLCLVVSNLAIAPAIVYAFALRLIPETALLVSVFVASTAFHVCQVGWFCFGVGVRDLQVADHFMVYTALVWFTLYFCGVAERPRTGITIGLFPLLIVVIGHFTGTMVDGAVVVALTVAIALVALTCAFHNYGGLPIEWGAFAVATSLLAAGVFLHVYGGDFGDDDNAYYPIAHSVWHVLSMLSLFYILGIPFRGSNALTGAIFTAPTPAAQPRSRTGRKPPKATLPQPPAIPYQSQYPMPLSTPSSVRPTRSPTSGRPTRSGGPVTLQLGRRAEVANI